MTWFEELTSCTENSGAEVRRQLYLQGGRLHSRANGQSWAYGELETPSLADLRDRASELGKTSGNTTVREVVANVQDLHSDPANQNALFQVASQFNLLEMMAPDVKPEYGIGIYERDPTQGPACAIAAGAGTIFRHYFVEVDGQIGQSEGKQIDCLADLGGLLGNSGQRLWKMENGYALPSESGLREINDHLSRMDDGAKDELRCSLRIGIQWNMDVTIATAEQRVSQAFCSALPILYTEHSMELWEPFARLVLEATYEATLCAAIENAARTGVSKLFLTLVGGGAFGNDLSWIIDALKRSIFLYPASGLDIAVVSYWKSKSCVQELVHELNTEN
ncbi:MAG: hypothetical protein AAF483_00795 [Planctomycetota bacterium]